jgi:hypothetical protein
MEWLPYNYLRMTIKHCVEIDMTNYPGGRLVEPKIDKFDHLKSVLDGWKDGRIKWVRLTADQVERKREQLEHIE